MFAVCSIDTNNLFESFNNCSKLGFSNNNDTIIFKIHANDYDCL